MDFDFGMYNLIVMDVNGCVVIDSFLVGVIKLLGVILVDFFYVSCNGVDDVFLQVQGIVIG